jgi:outer membrane receptor protein involved in Fe transport
LRWSITDSLQVRAAAFRTLRPNLFIQETLEPTQVAGFTQMIDDTNETFGWTYGIGLDADLGQKTFAGAEARFRQLERPFRTVSLSTGELSTEFHPQYERYIEAYLYRTLGLNWALGATLRYDFVKNDQLDPRRLETISLPLEVRYFNESGLFASFGTNFLRQNFEPGYGRTFIKGRDEAVILDAAIGFRLPNRRGLVSFEVHNLLDTDFRYQDHAYISSEPNLIPDPRFQPERTFLVRVNVNF